MTDMLLKSEVRNLNLQTLAFFFLDSEVHDGTELSVHGTGPGDEESPFCDT